MLPLLPQYLHHQSTAQATSPVDVKHQEAEVVQTLLLVVLGFHQIGLFGWVVAHVD